MRVLVISDIHANQAALESVLAAAAGQYDTLWCLGDVVGYGPRPNECIELVRERASLCVMGNHDWAVLGRPGINVDDFNPQARQAVLWTREQLTDENRRYLDQLPDTPVHPPDTAAADPAHPRQPARTGLGVYSYTFGSPWRTLPCFSEPLCLVGHTHKPAIFRWQGLDSCTGSRWSGHEHMATVDYLQPRPEGAIKLDVSDIAAAHRQSGKRWPTARQRCTRRLCDPGPRRVDLGLYPHPLSDRTHAKPDACRQVAQAPDRSPQFWLVSTCRCRRMIDLGSLLGCRLAADRIVRRLSGFEPVIHLEPIRQILCAPLCASSSACLF